MASIVVDQGLEAQQDAFFGLAVISAPDAIGVSDYAGAVPGTETDIANGAVFTQVNALTAGPTRSGQTVSQSAVFTDAQIGGQALTTFSLHNAGAAATTGLIAAVDGQALTFSGVDITVTIDHTLATA